MSTVIWVPSIDSLDRLTLQLPELGVGTLLLTADTSVSWLCEEQNRPHKSLWHHTSLSEQVEVAEQALGLADTWLSSKTVMAYQGTDLAKLGSGALLYLFRDALLAHRMIARFLDQTSPDRLLLDRTGSGTHTGTGAVEGVLEWEARQRGIAVDNLLAPPPVAAGSGLQRWATRATSPLHLLSGNRFARNLSALLTNASLLLRMRHQGKTQGTVIFFGSGTDFVNQLHIIERLRAMIPGRVIHVSLNPIRASAYSRSQAVARQQALHLLAYGSPGEYWTLRALGRRAWSWFGQARLSHSNDYPELFLNPYLDPMFRRFFLHTLPRTGGALGATGQLLDLLSPDMVILNNDASGRERAIVQAARQRGIMSIQLVHSGFNDLHFRRFSTDQMWVWGNVHKGQLAGLGLPDDCIQVMGNPNYDYLDQIRQAATTIRADVRRELGLAERELVLLLMTAKSPHLLTFVDSEQHSQDLKALCQALDRYPHVRLIVKPHPRYDEITVYRLLAQKFSWLTVVEHTMLDRLLPACDIALMVNIASTAGIEAMLLGKPTVWICPSVRYPPSFSLFEPGVLTVKHRTEIGPALQRLVSDPDYRQAIADAGRRYLPDLVAHWDGGATDAVVAAIKQIGDAKHKEGV